MADKSDRTYIFVIFSDNVTIAMREVRGTRDTIRKPEADENCLKGISRYWKKHDISWGRKKEGEVASS